MGSGLLPGFPARGGLVVKSMICLTLTQRAYALKILEKFKMQNCRGAKTPVDPTVKLSLADCPQVVDPVLQAEYRAKVGSLQYLCIWTRPDLNKKCRYCLVFYMLQDLSTCWQ